MVSIIITNVKSNKYMEKTILLKDLKLCWIQIWK